MSAHKSKMKKKWEEIISKKILDHDSQTQRKAKLFNSYDNIIWEIRNSFKSDRSKMKSYQNKRNKAVVVNYRQACTFSPLPSVHVAISGGFFIAIKERRGRVMLP